MNTNFRRFKTLALRIMVGDALKVHINDATSIFLEDFMTFCMCVSLCDGNKHFKLTW